MMKKMNFMLTAALLFSVLTGGCAVSDPPYGNDNPAVTEISVQQSPSLMEKFVGIYRTEGKENGRTVLEIYRIGDTLIAEAEQEYAAYFAAELIPDTPAALSDSAAEEAGFTVYAFSGFSNFGAYWEETPQITLALTDSGLSLREADGTSVEFQRDTMLDPLHIPDRYAEILTEFSGEAYPETMCGTWTAETWGNHSIILRMNRDGTLLWYCKTTGEPVRMHIGCGTVIREKAGTGGLLTVVTERVGYGAMPMQYTLAYELTGMGLLLLRNMEPDGLLPTEDEIALTQYTEQE